jgi:hypothetical protein
MIGGKKNMKKNDILTNRIENIVTAIVLIGCLIVTTLIK